MFWIDRSTNARPKKSSWAYPAELSKKRNQSKSWQRQAFSPKSIAILCYWACKSKLTWTWAGRQFGAPSTASHCNGCCKGHHACSSLMLAEFGGPVTTMKDRAKSLMTRVGWGKIRVQMLKSSKSVWPMDNSCLHTVTLYMSQSFRYLKEQSINHIHTLNCLLSSDLQPIVMWHDIQRLHRHLNVRSFSGSRNTRYEEPHGPTQLRKMTVERPLNVRY